MYFLDENKTYNTNYGLSQTDRVLDALSVDFFSIDQFDFPRFLNFISNYATQVSYFNERNTLDGDWTSFLNNDPTLSLLRLAFHSYDELMPFDDKLKNNFSSNVNIRDLLFFYSEKLIKQFIFIEQNMTKLDSFPQFKLEQEKLIKTTLSSTKKLVYIALRKINKISKVASENEFGSCWESSNKFIDLEDDLFEYLSAVNKGLKKTINVLGIITNSAREFYDLEVHNSKKVSPHIALLLTFHRLYEEASSSMNSINEKHLIFYYKEILQIPNRSKKPDYVHVSFLSNAIDDVEVKKGEILLAGKNHEGNEIQYIIDKTILLNSAKIGIVKGLDFNSNADYFLNRFDGEKKIINLGSTNSNLGFAFGSAFLKLDEGVRKISFDISFSAESSLSQLFDKNIESLMDTISKTTIFRVAYTFEDGWFEIHQDKIDTFLQYKKDTDEGFKLKIVVLVDAIDPPIQSLSPDNEDYSNNQGFPYFKFILDHTQLEVYHCLKQWEISKIDLNVEVLDIKNLLLSNDFGAIEIGAPFEPFGSQPIIGSSFIIGHPTIFLYPIEDLKINFEWYGLPSLEGGFQTYYRGYPWEVDNNTFESKLSFLRNKRWIPDNEKQVISLFQEVSDGSEAVSNIRRINEISVRELGLKSPSLSKGFNLPFDNNSKDGFLKLELCYPLEAFGHQQYPELLRENSIKAVSKKSTASPPNEPYTPTLKSISVDINSTMSFSHENSDEFSLYHLHQSRNQKITSLQRLLPVYNGGSTMIIGIKDYNDNKRYSMLFQINEGYANEYAIHLDLEWFLYSGDSWVKMNDKQLINDNTNKFKRSGIIDFDLTTATVDNTGLFTKENIWIKVENNQSASFLNYIQDVVLHTTLAKCHNFNEVSYANLKPNQILEFQLNRQDISQVIQKYHGFKGSKRENDVNYFLRVAERLRHKNRAVSSKDYERILLDNFPSINRVKCLSNIDEKFNLSTGKTLIVVVPKSLEDENFKGAPRYFSSDEIDEMELFLSKLSPIGVELKVTNPIYESVRLKFSIKLKKGYEQNFYFKKLNKAIKSFISPWMYDFEAQVELGQSVSSALLLNFIDKQEYVDHILNFSLFHIVNNEIINQKTAKSNTVEITPTSLISILISDDSHIIIPYDKKDEGDNFGINEMMIDTDYIVDYQNDRGALEKNNLTIEKSYKIMPAKEENNLLKSNFTFYITH